MNAPAHHLAEHVIASDRRKLTRNDYALETLMCDRENHTFSARILNISNGGVMAQVEAPLCEHDAIRIDLPTIGWLRADIVWVLGDRVGAQFRDPIDLQEFAAFQRIFG
ncbi:MAG: PilZ domain-containing protein [Sphingomonadaceae bacterium]